MIFRTKKGFSLIEVMLLFVVLAVVMAASVPVITRKTPQTPIGVQHGMYRCYVDNNGQTIEETYSANSLVNVRKNISECTFKVPQSAALYQIDLFSAGSGGYNYAAIKSEKNDERKSKYTLANGYQNEKGSPVVPTDRELMNAFGGLKVIKSVQTPVATGGGNVDGHFHKVKNTGCRFYDASGKVITASYLSNAQSNINTVSNLTNTSGQCSENGECQNLIDAGLVGNGATIGDVQAQYNGINNDQLSTEITSYGNNGSANRASLEGADYLNHYNLKSSHDMYVWYNGSENNTSHFISYCKDVKYKTIYDMIKFNSSVKLRTFAWNDDVPQNYTAKGGIGGKVPSGYEYIRLTTILQAPTIQKPLNEYFMHYIKNGKLNYKEYLREVYYNAKAFYWNPEKKDEGTYSTSIVHNDSIKYESNYAQCKKDSTNSSRCWFMRDNAYVAGEDGEDVKVLPSVQYLSANGGYKSIKDFVTNRATKGLGARVGLENVTIGSNSQKIQKIIVGYNPRTGTSNNTVLSGQDGSNTVFNSTYKFPIKTDFYEIDKASGDMELSPVLNISANLYKKTYYLGNKGQQGKHWSAQKSNLGSVCTIRLPKGGRPINSQDTQSVISNLEKSLYATMVCKDGENIVLNETLEGANYIQSDSLVKIMKWKDDLNEIVNKIASDDDYSKYPKLSKLLKLFKGDEGLKNGDVIFGSAGSAPVLTDKCLVPKGEYSMNVTYEGKNSDLLGKLIRGTSDIISMTENPRDLSGIKDGENCYPGIDNEKFQIEKSTKYLDYTPATKGGPGAVIITW